jgi:hypothetical protein
MLEDLSLVTQMNSKSEDSFARVIILTSINFQSCKANKQEIFSQTFFGPLFISPFFSPLFLGKEREVGRRGTLLPRACYTNFE